MADIHIERAHALGLSEARRIALQWAEKAQTEFGLKWSQAQGDASDLISFGRSGVTGTLALTENSFVIDARLGFLAGVFKDRIEAEIVKNLDALLLQGAGRPEVAADRATVRKKTA